MSNQQTHHVLQKCHVFFRLKCRHLNISSVVIVHATSLNNNDNYVFTATVETSSSTYTNLSTMTTHLFFMCPSLNTATGSHNIIKFIYNSRTEQNLLSGGNFRLYASLPTISRLGDVPISSLSINQIMQWNSCSSKRIDVTLSGSSTLTNNTYCSISTPSANQVLR